MQTAVLIVLPNLYFYFIFFFFSFFYSFFFPFLCASMAVFLNTQGSCRIYTILIMGILHLAFWKNLDWIHFVPNSELQLWLLWVPEWTIILKSPWPMSVFHIIAVTDTGQFFLFKVTIPTRTVYFLSMNCIFTRKRKAYIWSNLEILWFSFMDTQSSSMKQSCFTQTEIKSFLLWCFLSLRDYLTWNIYYVALYFL